MSSVLSTLTTCKKCSLTSELSNGKFDGVSEHLQPLTRSYIDAKYSKEDAFFVCQSIPTKDDLHQVLEGISTALVDPAKDSYGLKGLNRFSFSKLSFDPEDCSWNGEINYKIDIVPSATGSFRFNIQCFKISLPKREGFMIEDSSYETFIVVDVTSSLTKSAHKTNKYVLTAWQKTFDGLTCNVLRELYKLYLPDDFPEGCKGKTFRSIYQLNKKVSDYRNYLNST